MALNININQPVRSVLESLSETLNNIRRYDAIKELAATNRGIVVPGEGIRKLFGHTPAYTPFEVAVCFENSDDAEKFIQAEYSSATKNKRVHSKTLCISNINNEHNSSTKGNAFMVFYSSLQLYNYNSSYLSEKMIHKHKITDKVDSAGATKILSVKAKKNSFKDRLQVNGERSENNIKSDFSILKNKLSPTIDRLKGYWFKGRTKRKLLQKALNKIEEKISNHQDSTLTSTSSMKELLTAKVVTVENEQYGSKQLSLIDIICHSRNWDMDGKTDSFKDLKKDLENENINITLASSAS